MSNDNRSLVVEQCTLRLYPVVIKDPATGLAEYYWSANLEGFAVGHGKSIPEAMTALGARIAAAPGYAASVSTVEQEVREYNAKGMV